MGKRLYVGNLSGETNDASLRRAFASCGNVEVVRLMTDKGISRGFAFIEMSTEREAMNALKTLNGTELDGSNIVVNEANPPGNSSRSSDGFGAPRRSGGGRRFGGGGGGRY